MLLSQLKKYICCFMRATHAINNIYKLISFWNYYLRFFFIKLHSDQDYMQQFNSNYV